MGKAEPLSKDYTHINWDKAKPIWKMSWDDIQQADLILHQLLRQILSKHSQPKISLILALARGGVIPAALLARYYPKVPFQVITVKSKWEDQTLNHKAKIRVGKFDWKTTCHKHVLVIDDILDTGMTIDSIQDRLPPTACATYLTVVTKQPALYPHVVSAFQTNPHIWVKFPWETKGD